MYHLIIFLLICLAGYLVVDWTRFRELLPAVLTGMLLAGVPSALPGLDPLYRFVGSGRLHDHWMILWIVQMGVAPVLTAWYAQGLPRTRNAPLAWRRIVTFGLLCSGLEISGSLVGKLEYAPWWGPLNSFIMHLVFLGLIARVHSYTCACGSPHHGGVRPVREVTTGVLPSLGHGNMAPDPQDC